MFLKFPNIIKIFILILYMKRKFKIIVVCSTYARALKYMWKANVTTK